MEISNPVSKLTDGRQLLLTLYEQQKNESSTNKNLDIQRQIDAIVAQNFLRYINGSQ